MKNKTTHLTRKLVVTACAATLLATSPMVAGSVFAGNREQANLSYNVYIGASKMFKIGLATTLTANSYRSDMHLKPKGLAKLFANISMVMSVQGKLKKNLVQPAKFSFYRKKKKRKRTSDVTWPTSGKPTTLRTYEVGQSRQAELKRAISSDMPDPLSAFLRMGIIDAKAPCNKAQRIYDGGKVYDLKFKLLKQTVFGPKSNGAYKGPAYKCQLEHQPIAGYSQKNLGKLKANPAVFTVWFAPVTSTLLNKQILLPIAASGKVKGRAFSAFANRATFAGKPL